RLHELLRGARQPRCADRADHARGLCLREPAFRGARGRRRRERISLQLCRPDAHGEGLWNVSDLCGSAKIGMHMNFDGDAFISYAHLDNIELIEGRKGWVANLHRALEVRVGQLLGKEPHIWRDPKLQGNDFFTETLIERLQRVASLITVVSPRYVKSEWTRRELAEFWKAAEQQGGIRIREKEPTFKL